MITIGQEELNQLSNIKENDIIIYTHENGEEEECVLKITTDLEGSSTTLGYITPHNGKTYFASLNGKLMNYLKKKTS